ncbi:M28 family metallopeptidase [Maricaulis sp.]|uniref:M28 family metallopeptidase n=1 Tax=Maricaulis sp. TaxID=1486257 RepID=UPI002B26EF76|nr:M28 family peptidase [Maricaulis sp.]
MFLRVAIWVGALVLVTGAGQAQTPFSQTQRDFLTRLQNATAPARSSASERDIAADFLVAELERRGLAGERRTYHAPNVHPLLDLIMPPFTGVNVTATIPATRASAPVIVLGAHYDSEAGSPGADDNGSGVAAVLTIAENLAAEPRRDFAVILVLFDQEEEGKVGSAAYARQLLNAGVDIHSMHSIDMAGWDSDGDGAIEIDAPDTWYPRYDRAARSMGIPIVRVTYDSSDHVSFRNHGIDAICLGEAFRLRDASPHRHRPTDTADTLNHDYLARNTRLMLTVLLDLIRGDTP